MAKRIINRGNGGKAAPPPKVAKAPQKSRSDKQFHGRGGAKKTTTKAATKQTPTKTTTKQVLPSKTPSSKIQMMSRMRAKLSQNTKARGRSRSTPPSRGR
jgi:hypothetical protein